MSEGSSESNCCRCCRVGGGGGSSSSSNCVSKEESFQSTSSGSNSTSSSSSSSINDQKSTTPSSTSREDDDDDDQQDSSRHATTTSSSSTSSDNEESSSSSSSTNSTPSSNNDTNTDDDSDDDVVAQQQQQQQQQQDVRRWTLQIPIGLGLCPWAMTSQRQGRLRITTCNGSTPEEVTQSLFHEIKTLVASVSLSLLPLSTTLLVCPNVPKWQHDFDVFDQFVKNVIVETQSSSWTDDTDQQFPLLLSFMNQVTLVSFHPHFLRWRGLPNNNIPMIIGSVVQCHKEVTMIGSKSHETYPATILETSNRMFGRRKIKVQFHNNNNDDDNNNNCNNQQYVPVDWIKFEETGPPLPDNAMHRAPYPTIHIIKNTDLAKLCIRDVSRVKRKNAQRMMKLGWEGINKRWNPTCMATTSTTTTTNCQQQEQQEEG